MKQKPNIGPAKVDNMPVFPNPDHVRVTGPCLDILDGDPAYLFNVFIYFQNGKVMKKGQYINYVDAYSLAYKIATRNHIHIVDETEINPKERT